MNRKQILIDRYCKHLEEALIHELLIEEELSNHYCKMLGQCRIMLQRHSNKPGAVCAILGCTIEILQQKQFLFSKMNNLLGNRIDRLLIQHELIQAHLQTISQSQTSMIHKLLTKSTNFRSGLTDNARQLISNNRNSDTKTSIPLHFCLMKHACCDSKKNICDAVSRTSIGNQKGQAPLEEKTSLSWLQLNTGTNKPNPLFQRQAKRAGSFPLLITNLDTCAISHGFNNNNDNNNNGSNVANINNRVNICNTMGDIEDAACIEAGGFGGFDGFTGFAASPAINSCSVPMTQISIKTAPAQSLAPLLSLSRRIKVPEKVLQVIQPLKAEQVNDTQPNGICNENRNLNVNNSRMNDINNINNNNNFGKLNYESNNYNEVNYTYEIDINTKKINGDNINKIDKPEINRVMVVKPAIQVPNTDNKQVTDIANKSMMTKNKTRKCNLKSIEKKYHCTQCSKKYKVKKNLLLHVGTHQGEGYKCRFCHKLFPRRQNMIEHERIQLSDSQLNKTINICFLSIVEMTNICTLICKSLH